MEVKKHDVFAFALLGLSVLLGLGGGLVLPVIAAPAPTSDLALVIVPPWVDAGRMTERAGGRAVGPVQAPFAVLSRFEGVVPVDDLKRAGAWSVVDGTRLALLCGVYGNDDPR